MDAARSRSFWTEKPAHEHASRTHADRDVRRGHRDSPRAQLPPTATGPRRPADDPDIGPLRRRASTDRCGMDGAAYPTRQRDAAITRGAPMTDAPGTPRARSIVLSIVDETESLTVGDVTVIARARYGVEVRDVVM